MSKTVDERVVQMRFDNRDFESNVKTSLSTIERLKQSLNFSSSSKGLENINAAAKNVDMTELGNGVETVRTRFSGLQIMAITALSNITNSAVNAGKKIVSALTIDPIKTGLEEYETKMNAIQVIQANTRGKNSMDEITSALDDLNTYADKTIYNFAQMTSNIGKFTAQGLDVKQAADAVKGMANLAAASGASAEDMSRATYQMSQALGGVIRKIDWNSLRNANMATTTLKDTLIDLARVHGVAIDSMIKSEGTFEDTLEKGWLTGDMFTEAMNIYSGVYTDAELKAKGFTDSQIANFKDLAKTAESAATEVKTFSQLWDVLKETAQSGWTQSWEYIIGDFETAKKDLTALQVFFSDMINASSDARNKVLADWKELGGRTSLIESLKNSFNGLMSIITPITEAFREIFPRITGEQLANFTKGLQNLTEKFKMNETTSNNLKRTFKGLFSILDIGKELFLAIGKAITPLVGFILKLTDGFLSITAVIGDYITIVAEAIDRTNLFGSIFEVLGKIIEPVMDFIKKGAGKISEFFNSLGSIDTSSLDVLGEKVKSSFEPFTKIGEFFKWIFSGISTIVSKIAPIISTAFNKISETLSKGFSAETFETFLKLLAGGAGVGILNNIKKFFGSLSEAVSNGGGLFDGIKDTLDEVTECFKSIQTQLKADTLRKIATAIAILAGSLFVISMIDSDKLASSLGAVGVLMGELMVSIRIFEEAAGDKKFGSFNKVATGMILMSTAVLILAAAMKKISDLDWNQIAKGLTSVAVLCGSLVASSKLMDENSKYMKKAGLGLIVFSVAINILAKAVEKLGQMDVKKLIKGLGSVAILCTELAAFLKVANLDGMGVTKGVGITLLATSLLILANAVDKFGSLDKKKIIKGLGSIGIVLLELTAFSKLVNGSKGIITTATGLTILSGAMLVFGNVVEKLGGLSVKQLVKGLGSMAAMLGMVTLAVNMMPKGMVSKGIALISIASSLVIMSKALEMMGGMTWEEIGKGLVTLAGSLIIIAGAMYLMASALPGAAALLIVASSLRVLAPVLEMFSNMTWEEIGKGLLMLAGAFTVIGLAGLILTPVIPSLIALSAAITLLGVGCLAAGVGVLAFSSGLAALAVSGGVGVQVLITLFTELINLIPIFIQKIGEGLVAFTTVIGENAVTLAEQFGKIITAIINKIVELTPLIVDAFLTLISKLLESVANHVPEFVQAGIDILLGFLSGIRDNIGEVVDVVADIIVTFLNALSERLPDIVDAAFNLIVTFITSLADAVETNSPIISDAIIRLFTAVINAGIETILGLIDSILEAGKNLIGGLISGVSSKIEDVKTAVGDIIDGCITKIGEFWENMKTAGSDLIGGLISGISGMIGDALDAVGNVASAVIEKARSVFDENSPSKVFEGIGMYLDEGLAIGLTKYSKVATNASEEVGKKTIKSFNNSLSDIDMNLQPSIRPVFDMTEVEYGAKAINSLFKNKQMVSLGLNDDKNIRPITVMMANRQNGNEDVISAINDLKDVIGKSSGDTYSINGITYDDGSNITDAVKSLVKAAKVERRI